MSTKIRQRKQFQMYGVASSTVYRLEDSYHRNYERLTGRIQNKLWDCLTPTEIQFYALGRIIGMYLHYQEPMDD